MLEMWSVIKSIGNRQCKVLGYWDVSQWLNSPYQCLKAPTNKESQGLKHYNNYKRNQPTEEYNAKSL